eukprot:8508079-Prorocentrum_lima.AAC.1
MERFLYCRSWSNQVTYVLTTDSKGRSQVKHGLHPTQLKPQDHLAWNLSEKPDGSTPTIRQWLTAEYPDVRNMWIRKDGATGRSAPFGIEANDWSHEQEEDFDLSLIHI